MQEGGRRMDSPESRPNPALSRGSKQRTAAAIPMTRTRSGSQPAPASSERSKRIRKWSAAVKERSNKGKRTKDDRIREDEEREANKRNLGREKEAVEVPSTTSSPHLEPNIPDPTYLHHPEISRVLTPAKAKIEGKSDRRVKSPILEYFRPSSLLEDPQLLPARASGTAAVLSASKFLLGLSSSVGDDPPKQCSGFWINWDEENKTGIVLTTAHLICSTCRPFDCWLGEQKYDPNTKVTVHLLDGTTAEGCLLYYQEHYDLAFFRVRVDQPVPLPSFNDGVKCAQEVFQLGRDKSFNLRITYGRAEYLNPNTYERSHYMYFFRDDDDNEYDDGGPVIDFDGKVVGMVNNSTRGSFIPSSILLKCLHLWRKFGYIPRLHLGLICIAIKLLDPVHVEKIWRTLNMDDGLIVEEVSKGSHAFLLGIRRGDVIESFNGECISTPVELENMLLSICEGHLDRGNTLQTKVDVLIGVFHPCERLRSIKELNVNVSDHGEVIKRATFDLTTEGSAASSPDEVGTE